MSAQSGPKEDSISPEPEQYFAQHHLCKVIKSFTEFVVGFCFFVVERKDRDGERG